MQIAEGKIWNENVESCCGMVSKMQNPESPSPSRHRQSSRSLPLLPKSSDGHKQIRGNCSFGFGRLDEQVC